MEFSFDVNPDLDIAVGNELTFEEGFETEFPEEEVDLSGVNPVTPTVAKPGSEDKVRMLAARYAAGVPLWHDGDCYDHGPSDGDSDFRGESTSDSRFELDDEF